MELDFMVEFKRNACLSLENKKQNVLKQFNEQRSWLMQNCTHPVILLKREDPQARNHYDKLEEKFCLVCGVKSLFRLVHSSNSFPEDAIVVREFADSRTFEEACVLPSPTELRKILAAHS